MYECTRCHLSSYTKNETQHQQIPAEYADEHYFQNDPLTNRERMLAGDFYISGDDADSARISQQGFTLCDEYYRATVNADPNAGRFLKQLVGSIGEDSYVKPPPMYSRSVGRLSSGPPLEYSRSNTHRITHNATYKKEPRETNFTRFFLVTLNDSH